MLEPIYRAYDRFMTWLDPHLPNIMMVLLGISMVLYGILAFYSYSDDSGGQLAVLAMMASVVVIGQGLVIIFDPNRNFIRSTVIFQFAIGLFRLLMYYQYFLDSISGGISVMTPSDYFLAAVYLILAGLGLLMFVTAVAIQMGFAFRRNSLMWSCIIQMSTALIYLICASLMFPDFEKLLASDMFQLRAAEFVVFMIVLYIFDSDMVRNGSTWGRHRVMVEDIRHGKVFDSNAYISPTYAQAILDSEKREWRVLMDCGPVSREYSFVVSGRGHSRTEMLAQIWKDDPCIHIISQGEIQTTLLFQHSIAADAIYEKDGFLRIEGRDGTMVSFAIREPTKDDYFSFWGTGA